MARFRCFATSQPRPFLFFSRRAFSFWWWSALVMQGNFALIFPCTRAPFWHAHLFAIHWISRSLLARAPVRSSLNMNTYTPPPKNISHRIYTIHVGHLFWFQNGEFRRKVRDFHAWIFLHIQYLISKDAISQEFEKKTQIYSDWHKNNDLIKNLSKTHSLFLAPFMTEFLLFVHLWLLGYSTSPHLWAV